ncbi:Mitochondrial import receptor subunit TOM40 [Candida viswanathii]|uniref:Mitochondrial import receptor subunit TOM40 n=1 Tax=Candida viswanathii TaxID=5486 RepID=A0A367XSK0_9ASCO|nr:Mitochondrial import receptor subunit TOM40 [Candida viswanathii]
MSQPVSPPLGSADIAKLSIPTLPQQNGFWSSNPVFSYINDVYITINEHRKSLGLTNPGTIENLNKEVSRDVFLNQYFFTGLRADLNKAFSMMPAFQTSHTLSIGSNVLPAYAFSALYATDDYFLQGNIDNDFSFSGRINYAFYDSLEQDYQANDFSINFKTLNPNFLAGNEFSGVIVGSILQSLTSKLAVGLETMYSKQPLSPPDTAVSYVARYNAGDWIASAQLQAQGALIASFWRKVTDKVEAGLETQVAATMKQVADPLMGIGFEPVIEGQTTIGAKYEYRTAVFRGLGLQFEAAGNEQLMLMQQGLVDANGNPIPGATVA